MQKNIQQFFHKEINDDVRELLNNVDIRVTCSLDEIVNESGLTQKQFGEKYNLRSATISELMNLKKKNINIVHLAVLMYQLGITDIRELFNIEISQ